ncbi:hypothetical protein PBI_KEPLER_31 [Arthrobacter phage Kepler]|uniref:Uncharacterized protein n=2 Tax=Coralvirus TaxID=2733171 RepID=A0A3G2KFC1_9CAUD|nr:hypothetical protein HOU55_gp31 [Arthrobacter phage Kepler]AYN57679.1 hypothetical protein PBI_DAOB_32 [Arthrobacter phage Daob]AYN58258.1 hypothetical protein PBI_KEPLER_31 [Arthrobacter phage Kepler]
MTTTKKQRAQAEHDALMAEEPCPHDDAHRAGIVTNQPDGYDRNRSHAAIAVCGDPSCRARALGWVYRASGEHGTYVSDSDRRKLPA